MLFVPNLLCRMETKPYHSAFHLFFFRDISAATAAAGNTMTSFSISHCVEYVVDLLPPLLLRSFDIFSNRVIRKADPW